MTTYATRSPLQLLSNTHMMADTRRTTRRTSARLADKEDIPLMNGVSHATEKTKTNGIGLRSGRAGVNGATGGRGKRKHEYDEEDDGFMFTRTRSKKAKAAPAVQPPEQIIEEQPEHQPRPITVKKSRKKSAELLKPVSDEKEEKQVRRRRSPRNSGESIPDAPVLEVKKRRVKDANSNASNHDKVEQPPDPARVDGDVVKSGPAVSGPIQLPPVTSETVQRQPVERPRDGTKIALPFADTPIIRRNKEMRKGAETGHRRSSLGNRGRRASSLIDSGKSNALPHSEVDSSEFYKHIESANLPEPRRMRQLLTWCGTRALGDRPSLSSDSSSDSSALLAAREIQQQLLRDFSTKSELSDWFSRKRDSPPPPQAPLPNPKNVANLSKIAELESRIAALQRERSTWTSLLTPPGSILPPISPSTPPLDSIDTSLLSPSQADILTTLHSYSDPDALTKSTQTRIEAVTRNLEFEVDKFAENVHMLGAYTSTAGRIADEVLAVSAEVLEERDRRGEGSAEIGTRAVLRGLSRVIER